MTPELEARSLFLSHLLPGTSKLLSQLKSHLNLHDLGTSVSNPAPSVQFFLGVSGQSGLSGLFQLLSPTFLISLCVNVVSIEHLLCTWHSFGC